MSNGRPQRTLDNRLGFLLKTLGWRKHKAKKTKKKTRNELHVNAPIYGPFSKSTSKSAAFKPSVASPPLNQTRYNLNANQFQQQALLGLTDFLLVSRGTGVMRLCWRTEDQWTFNTFSCELKKIYSFTACASRISL